MVRAHDVDVVMLAECAGSSDIIEMALAQQTDQNYRLAPSNDEENDEGKTRVFSRLEQSELIHQFSDYTRRLSIRSLHLSGQTEDTLLAVVHLPSRVNSSLIDDFSQIVPTILLPEEQWGRSPIWAILAIWLAND